MKYVSIPEFGFIRIRENRELNVKDLFNRTLELSVKIQEWIEKRDNLRDLIPENCYVVHPDWDLNDPNALVFRRTVTNSGKKGIAFAWQSCYMQRYANYKAIRQNEFIKRYDIVTSHSGWLYKARQLYRNLILSLVTPSLEKYRNFNAENSSGRGRLVIGDHWFYVHYENDTFGGQWVIDWEDPVEWKVEFK